MDRVIFSECLTAYAPFDVAETAMRDQMREFVAANEACVLDRKPLEIGHITTSCWIVKCEASRRASEGAGAADVAQAAEPVATDGWAHIEAEDRSLLESALREAREEMGLQNVRPLAAAIFDLDVHLIPERKGEPAHNHYDVRFLFEAESCGASGC